VRTPLAIDNDRGYLGCYIARAALNLQTGTLAAEIKLVGFNIAVVAINPGHVVSRLTNFKSKVDIDVALASLF
jgi:NAD(P)-dependent dehydrogenase (short-subunit alcohol dehydrogenase family)